MVKKNKNLKGFITNFKSEKVNYTTPLVQKKNPYVYRQKKESLILYNLFYDNSSIL